MTNISNNLEYNGRAFNIIIFFQQTPKDDQFSDNGNILLDHLICSPITVIFSDLLEFEWILTDVCAFKAWLHEVLILLL